MNQGNHLGCVGCSERSETRWGDGEWLWGWANTSVRESQIFPCCAWDPGQEQALLTSNLQKPSGQERLLPLGLPVADQEICSRPWWSLAGLCLVWVAILKTLVRARGFTLFWREGFVRGFSCSLLHRVSVSTCVWWGSLSGFPCLCSLFTALSNAAGHSTLGPLSQPLNLSKN